MNCDKVREAMYLSGDEEAEEELLSPCRDHLEECPTCSAHLEYVTKFVAVLRRRCRRQSAPSELRDRILESLPRRDDLTSRFAE